MQRGACDDFWRDVSSTRLSQLGEVAEYPAASALSRSSIRNKEEHLQSSLAALRDQRRGEVEAIILAKKAVEDHYSETEHALIAAIALLRTQSNELAPVSRLPPEILSLVFASLSYTQPPRQLHRCKDPTQKSFWVVVTHVCRRWRQVALEQRCLWARIQIPMGKAWARAFLERAGSLPLSIVQDQASHYGLLENRVLQFVTKNLPRVKDLQICIPRAHMFQAEQVLQIPAPMLESLDVKFPHYVPADDGILFGVHAPRLRHLRIVGWRFPWTSPILQDLVTLDLHYTSSYLCHSTDLVPLATIISALKNVPQLEQLAVHLALPERDATANLLAELPSLTSLRVTGMMGNTLLFLRHLIFPPNVEVSLEVEN
ncbi:hypothetical protein FA95DRAFT_125414 [Auriscalpium vulgare]|uniref:Uncharacterized protein n=1 Tax=Auriscalpium vulgare TaxID=40419 RepID=A0ACB8RN58_9AGAM|nr:hypothetical protein FA95DRAFT_125414 [Auriscalpium vulgare]